MDHGSPDLFADLSFACANRFNVLLIEHDVVGSRGHVEDAFPGCGHAPEKTQNQPPSLSRLWWALLRRQVLYQNSNVMDAIAKFRWKRVQCLLDHFDKMFALHDSALRRSTNRHCKYVSRLCIVRQRRHACASPTLTLERRSHVLDGRESRRRKPVATIRTDSGTKADVVLAIALRTPVNECYRD